MRKQASNNRKLLSPHGGGGERYGKGVSTLRHVRVGETNASEPLMRPRNRSTGDITTGAPPLSGRSIAETWLLAVRCPGYRWRDSNPGSGPEFENLFSGAKGKGASGSPARPKVPARRAGADCLVVATKRSNAREANGQAIRVRINLVNWQREEPTGLGGSAGQSASPPRPRRKPRQLFPYSPSRYV